MIENQIDLGIKTKIMLIGSMPQDYIQDFGLWDDELVYYLRFSSDLSLVSADIYTDRVKLMEVRKIRDFLLQETRDAQMVLEECKNGRANKN